MAADAKSGINRRSLLGDATAVTATAVLGATTTAARAQTGRKTFVLVHGGWRGGWCWIRVANLLESRGHKVYTPTLTGLGERSHLLRAGINLDTHTTDVVNVFKFERLSDVVLVGHSVGGLVITPVAQAVRDKISSIVYLDAFLPEVGDSANSTASQASRDAQAAALASGQIATPPLPAKVFGDDPANWAWIDSLSTPHPLETLIDKTKAIDGRESIARKTYVRALGYKNGAFETALAKTKADRTWTTFEVQSGHDVMIDKPADVAEILLQSA